jgi:two-component system phosphate regulon sensor histidine kinase PhoR
MKILFDIHSFFSGNKTGSVKGNDLDNVILFTKSIIVREDLIAALMEEYKRAQSLDSEGRVSAYIKIYFGLEQFIINNKPLVVQKIYTKETLREDIRNRMNLQNLPETFRLIFLPKKEQFLLLFEPYTQMLAQYISHQTGATRLQEIIASVTKGTDITDITITSDSIDFSALKKNIDRIPEDAIISFFQKLNTALFSEISSSFGSNMATDLTQKNYNTVKERYDYDSISTYLKAVPQNVLEKERLLYVTKDLEKQTKSAAGSEAKLLASITSLPLGFILTDADEKIITINSAVKNIMKLPEGTQEINDIDAATKQVFEFKTRIEQTKISKKSIELKEVNFAHYILHVTITPIFITDKLSEYIGTVILVEDITEIKLLDRTKDEFFAIAAHELRTPLTIIKGGASMIKETYGNKITDPEFIQMIDRIDQSSSRMADLIDNFLRVSEIEQGKIKFIKEKFSINDVILKVTHELDTLVEAKHIVINIENKDGSIHEIVADKDKTRQVCANVIGNAVKFTTQGSVTVGFEEKDNFVFVKVTDTGKGIPSSNQHLLFGKFQQTENYLMRDVNDSAGLGLYISKKLIENMGGEIYLEKSEENKGSTFTFSLPKTSPQ